MMNSIDLPKLRNAEYLQYMKDFSSIINLNNAGQFDIETKLNAFTTKIGELEALYKKALASEKTQAVLALDERRDAAMNGINYFLLSQTYHFQTENRKNAQLLLDSINMYGSSIARLNYQAETATLNNLIRDWENKPELTNALMAFNLLSWVNEMKAANDEFNTQYLSRTQEYGDANPETIKIKREEVNLAYYALRNRIDALHLLVETPPSPYVTVINQLNALTDQYNVLLFNRKPDLPDSINPEEQTK
ncbi:DUF6261 family protein [Chryseobacterium turcicum]|uniref:DUF6261 family protein n=1 Tax=Chryseobacterium turcicum TaxID=2898076 RepID=A0A9Q3V154_9FLAO|nr:DUF6261 family protein [Chryseobacterium turcicum]MCD1116222.1 DUF6261 family protein [Chryseobacterium turcicum]